MGRYVICISQPDIIRVIRALVEKAEERSRLEYYTWWWWEDNINPLALEMDI